MLRAAFDQHLGELRRDVLQLGAAAAAAVERAVQALRDHDVALARQVIAGDRQLDDWHHDIETRVVWLIASQQPVARDLRLLATALAVSGELERIGDYAKGIAKVARRLAGTPSSLPDGLDQMVERVLAMLRQGLAAYAGDDAAAARRLWREDEAIDALQERLYAALFAMMQASSANIYPATRLLRVVHNLERVADRVTNICERVTFVATGDLAAFRPRDP